MEVVEMIERYQIRLATADETMRSGISGDAIKMDGSKVMQDGMVDTIKANKSAIVEALKAQIAAEAARYAKIEAIDGLAEIRAAQAAYGDYRAKLEQAQEDETAVWPARPQPELDDVVRQYPRAAAYVKADEWSLSDNYRKAAAGARALNRIIDGEDYERVLADMESEWTAYVNCHLFD